MLTPKFRSVKKLTSTVIRLDNLTGRKRIKHSKYIQPQRGKIANVIKRMEDNSRFPEKFEFKVNMETLSLAEHEIKAVTVILTAFLQFQGQTEPHK